MSEILTDNRFELIEKYKQKLINATNIESDEKEMAAIDNILFRFWQMGWLDKLEESDAEMTVAEYRERMIEAFHNAGCDNLISVVVLPTEKEFQHLELLLKKEYVPFLKKANKALKTQQWIPCSERLPACFEPVITFDGHCYSVEKRIPYIRDEDGKPIKAEWWVSDDYDEMEETDYYPNLRDGAAIAWMPLPLPYEVKK